jgi:hypothetical protein
MKHFARIRFQFASESCWKRFLSRACERAQVISHVLLFMIFQRLPDLNRSTAKPEQQRDEARPFDSTNLTT